jgi:chromosome segregation ATPase
MKKIAAIMLIGFICNITFASTNSFLEKIRQYEQKKYKPTPVQVMKAWKAKKRKLIKEIYEQTNISSLMDLTTAAKQLDEVTEKLKTLSTSYKTIKLQKKSLDKKYKAVLQDARDLVIKLNKKSKELKNMLLKIQILSKDLENIRKQIKAIQDTIYISKQQVKKYIAVLYKINNDYYNSLQSLDDIKLLVKSNNIAKTLSQEDIIKILSLKTQELLGKLEKAEKIKKQFLRKMYLTRANYINAVNAYKTQIEVLNERKRMLVDLLTMLKSNKKQVDALYDRLYKNRVNLKKQQIKIAQ